MIPITDRDWARMSWHQRQQHLLRQTRQLRSIRDQIDDEQRDRNAKAATVSAVIAEAKRILATLDPDPEAGRHRAELEAALSHRSKERAA